MSDDKVVEVIEHLEPDVRVIIKDMVTRAGANGEITVSQLLKLYPTPDPNLPMFELRALVSLAFVRNNKFSPKLTFARRCEILALHRSGLPRETIATMYDVDRRTVTHIHNPNSPHYKNVRQEEINLGPQRFLDTYLQGGALNTALAFRQEKEKQGPINNKFAKTKEGLHVVRGKECEYEHRVVISWREQDGDIEVAGWYYRDLDGDYPDKWFCANTDACRTSQSCYSSMLGDITDRLL